MFGSQKNMITTVEISIKLVFSTTANIKTEVCLISIEFDNRKYYI